VLNPTFTINVKYVNFGAVLIKKPGDNLITGFINHIKIDNIIVL